MYKTILIPIDFQVASLNTLVKAMHEIQNEKVNVVLIYSEFLSDSIIDLLYYSPAKIIDLNKHPEFKEALEVVKNSFEARIAQIIIKHYHGKNNSAMRNFIEANKINEAYVPKRYKLKTKGLTFDPTDQLKRCGIQVIGIDWEVKEFSSASEQITDLCK